MKSRVLQLKRYIQMTGEEKVLTLYIGDENEDGNRYVMINDSRIVYLISDEICQNILNS